MLLTFSGQDYALVLPALHIRYMPGFFPQHPAPVLFYSDFHFFAGSNQCTDPFGSYDDDFTGTELPQRLIAEV